MKSPVSYTSYTSKQNALAVRNNYGVARDSALVKTIDSLKASKKELDGINKFVKNVCDLPNDRKRSILGKLLHAIVPEKAYGIMPKELLKIMAEEYDVLELIERLMRNNVNNVQDALRDLAACAVAKREELTELEADLEKAREEKWSAQALQEYMAQKAEIQIYDVVGQILSEEFNALSDEEKEERKNDLIAQLQGNVILGETLMETMGRVCSAGLQVFHQGMAQYFNYVHFYRPIAVIRESAKTMVEMNQSMYAGKTALVATFQSSLSAIEVAVDAAKLMEQYTIVGTDMKQLLEAGQKRLEEKVKALQSAKDSNVLKLTAGEKPKAATPTETVEAEVVVVSR